jgi:hypothetical protein
MEPSALDKTRVACDAAKRRNKKETARNFPGGLGLYRFKPTRHRPGLPPVVVGVTVGATAGVTTGVIVGVIVGVITGAGIVFNSKRIGEIV